MSLELLRRPPKWAYVFIVIALFLVFAAELIMSIRQQSQTNDEAAHIFSGYQYWRPRDFGANPEHPPLVKLVAAIPLRSFDLKESAVAPGPTKRAHILAAIPSLNNNSDAGTILFWTRMAASVFTFLLALLVLFCTYEMLGPGPALLGLALRVFDRLSYKPSSALPRWDRSSFLAGLVLLLGLTLCLPNLSYGQTKGGAHGTVERVKVHGISLEGNLEGDSPDRDVSIYLPPGYKSDRNRRYPVVYMLHGLTGDDDRYFGRSKGNVNLPEVIDKTLASGTSRPMIVVVPNAIMALQGSLYSISFLVIKFRGYVVCRSDLRVQLRREIRE